MLERLIANRLPISNVLADRNVTTFSIAKKLEITEEQWTKMEELANLLRPLQMATTVFCGDNYSPASIVRPLIWKLVHHHMQLVFQDSDLTATFKQFVSTELQKRFKLTEWENFSNVSARLTASFLDPRSKNLENELVETRQKVKEHVRSLMDTVPINTTFNAQDDLEKTEHKTALRFLFYQPMHCINDVESQFQAYLSEPQLRVDLDYLEWWKTRADKFPALAILARKYLSIPATSASAERTFSTAGNIVTPKRNCLSPENVNMLVFLYQNKSVYT
ncbi:PREDICTED: zinc finger BED domain-containing protein 1-like [Vollenhovia emeryi]|uniref:zinc finger BED domain-containing protein 1-like n=1 Tax=Vollenhovia emeryi TaxID=411798 RepID=UPI0005F55F89|nr:PREDICTED: zinc finger BED domain-containing protein 1-like [Vollenhovia emeryi]